jgi:hypothetical protein
LTHERSTWFHGPQLQSKIAGAPTLVWGVGEVPGWGISSRDAGGQPGRPASSDPRASFRRTGSDSGRSPDTGCTRSAGSPRSRCTPRSRPAAGRDRGTRAVRGHRRAHVGVVHARGWIRSGSLRRLSRMSWRLQQTAAPGLRLPVSFSRVCRSHPRSTRTVSGCACPGHGWTTTSRPLTMHRWQGGYWVPPRPPSSPVSRREPSNALLPPAANPSNRRWLVGVKDRRATCPMMRSGVARQQSSGLWRRPRALASRPRNQEARLPTCASYFTYRPRKLVAMWIAGQSSG